MTEQAERSDLEAAARALGLEPEEQADATPDDADKASDGESAPAGDEATEAASTEEAGSEAEAASDDADDEAPAAREGDGREGFDWYVVHTYSGYERKVKQSLEERIRTMGLGDEVGDVLIPMEDVVEVKGGKKVVTSKKFFPGYLLVNMRMSEELWHLVKNTPRVTGFVGEGRQAIPLSQAEVDGILNRMEESVEAPKPKFRYAVGETVRITDGPFANFTGKVEEVDERRNTLKVMVSIFGRATPVELDFFQVEKT